MKLLLKRIFNHKIISQLKRIKVRLLPSKYELEFIKNQKELFDSRRRFYSNFIRKGDICFDVGANIGNRTEVFLNLGAKVVAVEPQKSCYTILENKFGNKIFVEKIGLGAKEGVGDLHVSESNVLSSFSSEWINSVEKTNRFENTHWNKIVKTKISTLDNLITKYGIPHFIKIDVEGFELDVLHGLSKPIRAISFEYTVPEQINTAINCIKYIENISNNIECNFSSGESMLLDLPKWISSKEMKEYILTNEFIKTGFGDIYIRQTEN
jgi:FkbM family methyltransferase